MAILTPTSTLVGPAEEESKKQQHANWLLFCITTASLIYYLILFLTVPIAVQLMYAIVCDNIQDGEDCNSSAVSSETSRINLMVGLANNVPAFLLSGFYASLADRYGRKLCLIIPTLGYSAYVSFLLYMALRRSSGGLVSLTELALCCALGLFGLGIRYVHKQKCLLVFRRSLEVQLFLYIFHANTLTSLLPLLHLIYSIDTILSHHIHIHSGSFATY